jgi:hypothetical protein
MVGPRIRVVSRHMPGRVVTEEDRVEALRLLLAGLAAGTDIFDIIDAVDPLHPRHNTFPGEVYMGLAADALEVAGANREQPVPYDGLRTTHLPECQFRGGENRKIQYAILAGASVRGGLEPDLLDEVVWWRTDDFWVYALYAAVALIRASAEHQGTSVTDFAKRLAERNGIALS